MEPANVTLVIRTLAIALIVAATGGVPAFADWISGGSSGGGSAVCSGVTLTGDVTINCTNGAATVNGFGGGTSFGPFANGTDAANLTGGPVAASVGGAGTINGALKGNGSGVVSQAACADLSNGGTACTATTGTSGHTVPFLDGTNVYSGQNSGSVTTLNINNTTHFTPDGSNNHYKITLTAACLLAACTLDNPSATPVAGTSGVIFVTQPSSGAGAAFTWGTQYYTAGSGGTGAITFTTTNNAVDDFSYVVRDATHIDIFPANNMTH